jgi:hypothetical protein
MIRRGSAEFSCSGRAGPPRSWSIIFGAGPRFPWFQHDFLRGGTDFSLLERTRAECTPANPSLDWMQVSSDHPKGYAVFTPRAVVNEVATEMAYYRPGKTAMSDAIRDKYHGAISESYDADRTSRATCASA